jgi:hypothetical protein
MQIITHLTKQSGKATGKAARGLSYPGAGGGFLQGAVPAAVRPAFRLVTAGKMLALQLVNVPIQPRSDSGLELYSSPKEPRIRPF